MRDKQPCAPYASRPGPAAGAGGAPARGRLAGAGGVHRDAGVGGGRAARLPDGGGRPRAARPEGVPRAGVGRARPGRGRGCRADLPHAVERAQPPVLHLAPAQGVRRALARRGRSPPYARLARALRAELAEHGGGDHQLVLGEMAGILEPSSRATGVGGDDPRPAARARVRGAGVVPARLHRRHRPGRHGRRPRWRPAAARASTRSGSPRPASARRRAASRSRAGSPARRRAAGCCTGACAPGAPTRA